MDVSYYNLLKFLHIIFVTTWMAGLFYIPRLFVYHSKAKKNSSEYQTFIVMENKLMKFIMIPSLLFSWLFGTLLVIHLQAYNEKWLILKFVIVSVMTIFHMYCARIRKNFEVYKNINSEKFYRLINEIPTLLFVVIIFLVVFKPFN